MDGIEELKGKDFDILQSTGQVVTVNGVHAELFELPEWKDKDGLDPSYVGIDNIESFQRLHDGGIGALQDGDTMSVTALHNLENPDQLPAIMTVSRTGDSFTLIARDAEGRSSLQPAPPNTGQAPQLENDGGTLRSWFRRGVDLIKTGNHGLGLIRMGGRLADAAIALGFAGEDMTSPLPMPEALNRNIDQAQASGLNVPNVRFLPHGKIQNDEFVGAFADGDVGEFPASMQPDYLSHDLLHEHFRPLVMFRERAMKIAHLYAKAVTDADSIIAELPKEDPKVAINIEHPEMVGVELTGEDKITHAATCLDHYTTELAAVADMLLLREDHPKIISSEPFSGSPKNYWRHAPQMVRTIMASPFAAELQDHFTITGSQAMSAETGEFSYEIFTRELFREAQAFWEITPEQPPDVEVPPVAPAGGRVSFAR